MLLIAGFLLPIIDSFKAVNSPSFGHIHFYNLYIRNIEMIIAPEEAE